MKNQISKYAMLCVSFLILSVAAIAQVAPVPASTTIKKTVKLGEKWYIETTTKTYIEVNTQLLLQTENDTEESKRDDDEVERIQEQRLSKKNERIERNQLLKDALQKGYKPEATTIEDQEKIKKARAKLGVK